MTFSEVVPKFFVKLMFNKTFSTRDNKSMVSFTNRRKLLTASSHMNNSKLKAGSLANVVAATTKKIRLREQDEHRISTQLNCTKPGQVRFSHIRYDNQTVNSTSSNDSCKRTHQSSSSAEPNLGLGEEAAAYWTAQF